MINFNPKDRYGFADLVEIMALLRSPEGCPWDRAQDHASIRRNFIEEVYEAVDAIDQQDDAGLREAGRRDDASGVPRPDRPGKWPVHH